MKKVLVLACLVITLITVGCTKYSAMKGPFDGNAVNKSFVEYLVEKADDKLDLNEAQQQQLTNVITTMVNTALAQRDEVRALKVQIADELRKEHLDQARLDELMALRMQLFRKVIDSGKAELAAFHATLSKTQRNALAQFVLEHGKSCWNGTE